MNELTFEANFEIFQGIVNKIVWKRELLFEITLIIYPHG